MSEEVPSMNDHCEEVMDRCDGDFGQFCDADGDCYCICDVGDGAAAGDAAESNDYPDGDVDSGHGGAVLYRKGPPKMTKNSAIAMSDCRINNEGYDQRPQGLYGKIFLYGYPKGPIHKYWTELYPDGTIIVSRNVSRGRSSFSFIKLVGGNMLHTF